MKSNDTAYSLMWRFQFLIFTVAVIIYGVRIFPQVHEICKINTDCERRSKNYFWSGHFDRFSRSISKAFGTALVVLAC